VINVVTKSGTNKIHGSVYGFWTNNDLQSLNSYQKSFQGLTALPRSNTEFGGFTIEFPIVKDRLFFFNGFDQKLFHESSVYTSGSVSPTQTGLSEAAACSFVRANALAALKSYGPYAFGDGNPTVIGNPIQATITSDTGSTCPIEYGYVTRNVPERQHIFNWLPRADYANGKDAIVARYILARNNTFDLSDNGPAGWFDNFPWLSQAIKLGWTRVITQNIVSELSVGFGRQNLQFGGSSNHSDPTVANLKSGLTNVSIGSALGKVLPASVMGHRRPRLQGVS
jgi:hypothetical protein